MPARSQRRWRVTLRLTGGRGEVTKEIYAPAASTIRARFLKRQDVAAIISVVELPPEEDQDQLPM